MKQQTTQSKFLLLMGLVLCTFAASFVFLYNQGHKQAKMILEDKSSEKVALLQRMVALNGRSLESLAKDYSLWDDMVTFVRTGDRDWAKINICAGLPTFHADAAWVYDTSFHVVYDTSIDAGESLIKDTSIPRSIEAAIRRTPFNHFYVQTNLGTVEFHTSPIQPSDDDARVTPPKGYFVVCRLWDKEALASLSDAVGGDASAEPFNSGDSVVLMQQSASGAIDVRQVLLGPSGEPVALINCHSESPLYTIFLQSARTQMIYFALFCLGVLVVVLIAVRRWINRPLGRIMTSLQTATPLSEGELRGSGVEFHHIAELLSAYLRQQQELKDEIAEREDAVRLTRDREGLLKATLESTADGILVVDRAGSRTHWNAKFREMWRIPASVARTGSDDAMINFVLGQLVDPGVFLKKVTDLYDSRAESLDLLDFKDGRTFERFSCPLLRDHDVVGRVWSFRDISERKAAEAQQQVLQRQLEKAQRMESLGLLAGGVAHDLNNLLGPLVAYPEMILEDLPEDSPVREDIMRMGSAAEQASSAIQDLLAMARRGRYEMKPTDLNEVVTTFIDSIACRDLQSKRPHVLLRTELANEPLMLNGSLPHLMKVIMNLVGNAVEACPDGGQVTVHTERRQLNRLFSGYSEIPDREYVVLRVIDTGTGIAPEDIVKIFEPYFSKKKMGRSGSGLGLAVVHGIAQDHGGYYDVLSTLGKGSEFIFYFPYLADTVRPEAEEARDVRGRGTVLVVDDDKDQRAVSTRLISSLGYTVATVGSGMEAVEFLKNQEIDILVMDMIMDPGLDGLDTYREILKFRPNQRAIIATGFSATERVAEMQKLGAGSCVSKPYRREQIGTAIREELDRTQEAVANGVLS